jgi:hypothetical protein
MQVQCSLCGGDTDTGYRCVKCGHSMQPQGTMAAAGSASGNRQMAQLCRNCINLFGCADIHPDRTECSAFRQAT